MGADGEIDDEFGGGILSASIAVLLEVRLHRIVRSLHGQRISGAKAVTRQPRERVVPGEAGPVIVIAPTRDVSQAASVKTIAASRVTPTSKAPGALTDCSVGLDDMPEGRVDLSVSVGLPRECG